ncbi:MAG: hypothetical protein JK586_17200 [Nocardiopsis sp. BM-2018]|nr:MAG: hypothetical protein JK586_17200 [Nocardiopsis sp. BM-2018]
MGRWVGLLALLPLVVACSDFRMLGAVAVEQRRVMNDMQARATMAAVCDISLGAYWRELNEVERRYAGLVCGDALVLQQSVPRRPEAAALPEQLVAPERVGL